MSDIEEVLPPGTLKMKKDQLLDELRRVQGAVGLATRMQTVALARRKWIARGDTTTIHTVVISATEQELLDCAEFIEDLKDVAPQPLRRLASGARIMFEQEGEGE